MSVPRLLVCALVSALCAADAAAASLPCVPCGYGGGGRFTAVAVDPRNPLIVLAGSDVAGIFKSTDGGDSFVLSGMGLNSFTIAAIALHPELPDLVYALTDSGLYRSADCAQSWHLISSTVAFRERFFGSSLLVFFDGFVWAGTDRDGVFKIALTGDSPAVDSVPGLAGAGIRCLAVHRNKLHAATSHGLFRLEGRRWHALGRGLPAGGHEIIDLAAHASGRLYAVSKNHGLYRLDDETQSWIGTRAAYAPDIPGRPHVFKALAVHPQDPDRVFLATHPEQWPYLLLESRDAGRLWRRAGSFSRPAPPLAWRETPEAIEAISLCPQTPERMFLADWWNLWRSTDSGRNWQQLTRGLQNAVINDIRQHPGNPATLFMATADNGLLRSIDSGTSWQRIMNGVKDGHAMSIALSQPDGRAMYLLINPWQQQDRLLVYTSTDNGTTWKDIGFSIAGLKLPGLPFVNGVATNIVPDPHRDGVVYVGTNGYGVFKTTDHGGTWNAMNAGLDTPYLKGPDALIIHPSQPDTLFAGTQDGGIYKTTDGAQSWQRVSPDRTFVFGMAFDPFNPDHIIAACAGKKLLMSADRGSSWAERTLPGQTPEHIAAYAVAFDPNVPGRLYAGTLGYDCRAADGLYMSVDAGKTFTAVGLDLPRVSMNVLAVTRAPHRRLMMGFNGIGLYCADIGP
jgi:photosystem II stability/assembly factor-like uncharacterized protein